MTTRVALPSHRARTGVALLGALWLVLMIATVGTRFALAAQARRHLGLSAADRGRDDAVLSGALATVRARLETEERLARAARAQAGNGAANGPADIAWRDPWATLETQLADGVTVGEQQVDVQVLDLGTVRNVNLLGEVQLATMFATVLRDLPTAQALAQAIADWRDQDTLPRALGGEASAYARAGLLVRPTNGSFRDVDDVRDVLGMTPETFDAVRPLLSTLGGNVRVNLNAAPEAVLRTLPGVTEVLLRQILALRTSGRRIESVPALITASGASGPAGAALERQLTSAVTVQTRDVLLTLTTRATSPGPAASMRAVVHRLDDGSVRVSEQRW
jgi:type II secretory pathway component PulK